MEEREWIQRAAQGDQDAFALLLETHQNKVYALILRLVGSPEDAMDLTQETFFNAWRGLPGFHFDSKFSTWLYRLATNAAIDFLRREKTRRARGTVPLWDGEDRALDLPDRGPSPHSQLESKEFRQAVARALTHLSHEHRQVLVLRELNGLSYAEIAQALGLEVGTVKSRLSRARLALRNILLADGNFSGPPAST